jgi:ATP-binding protein involved in chromosome partitioning
VNLDTGAQKVALTTDETGRFRTVVNVFGAGGAELLAKKHGFPLLGRIPLNPGVRVGGDAGDPIVVSDPTSPLAAAFAEIAGRAAQRVAIKSFQALPILQ